jgi:DASS family divalent anion:Na+ symporter
VQVAAGVQDLGFGWQPSFAILLLVYFYSHYFFASNVAHVSAMYSAFLAVMVAAGTPAMLAALVLAFFSNTMGAISTWGMSHGPMFYGQGFLPQGRWLALSLTVSVWNITVWLVTGSMWWRFLGLW